MKKLTKETSCHFFNVCTKLAAKDFLFDKFLINSSICFLFSNGKHMYILMGGGAISGSRCLLLSSASYFQGGGGGARNTEQAKILFHAWKAFVYILAMTKYKFIS
jgi:hypothetical protein